jgi:hypothetical protein
MNVPPDKEVDSFRALRRYPAATAWVKCILSQLIVAKDNNFGKNIIIRIVPPLKAAEEKRARVVIKIKSRKCYPQINLKSSASFLSIYSHKNKKHMFIYPIHYFLSPP